MRSVSEIYKIKFTVLMVIGRDITHKIIDSKAVCLEKVRYYFIRLIKFESGGRIGGDY